MNNSVYINDKVGKFYYVANDEDYGYLDRKSTRLNSSHDQ